MHILVRSSFFPILSLQVIDQELVRNLLLAMAAVFIITLLLLANVLASFYVLVCVALTIVSYMTEYTGDRECLSAVMPWSTSICHDMHGNRLAGRLKTKSHTLDIYIADIMSCTSQVTVKWPKLEHVCSLVYFLLWCSDQPLSDVLPFASCVVVVESLVDTCFWLLIRLTQSWWCISGTWPSTQWPLSLSFCPSAWRWTTVPTLRTSSWLVSCLHGRREWTHRWVVLAWLCSMVASAPSLRSFSSPHPAPTFSPPSSGYVTSTLFSEYLRPFMSTGDLIKVEYEPLPHFYTSHHKYCLAGWILFEMHMQ